MLPVTVFILYKNSSLSYCGFNNELKKGQTLTVKLQAGFNKAVKLRKGLKGNFSGCELQMSKCALFSATPLSRY